MALFDRPIGAEAYAVVRFGLGYPALGAPLTGEAMLTRLAGPDRAAADVPFLPFREAVAMDLALRKARDAERNSMGSQAEVDAARKAVRDAYGRIFFDDLARGAGTDDPLRERLMGFWLNHFATRPRSGGLRAGHAGFAAEAIRPHLAGRFADMLKAAVTHPYMMIYLDQVVSVGPNSPAGRGRRKRGLNENLAREVLELHTLGVGASYSQKDVTEFAELLTGLGFDPDTGRIFFPARAEPGAETVLGQRYGGGRRARLADIHAVLEDLARHPATAAFLCTKLATYFVADRPDPDLVANMTRAFRQTDGALAAVYAAMLEHPAAWRDFGAKVKWPLDYMISTLRALGIDPRQVPTPKPGQAERLALRALRRMGQSYRMPPGPDGWPDRAGAWVHPAGLAARIGWALALAGRIPGGAPDPREFLKGALGDVAGSALVWAAGAAETRQVGTGIILASAEFNRR